MLIFPNIFNLTTGKVWAQIPRGPVTTRLQYDRVLDYINIATEEGATCSLGGKAVSGDGWFIEPTIYTSVTNTMRIAREEVFASILSIIPFEDDQDALATSKPAPSGSTPIELSATPHPSAATSSPATAANRAKRRSTTTSRQRASG